MLNARRQDEKYAFLMKVKLNVYAVRSVSVNGRQLLGHELTHVAQQTPSEIKLEARLIGETEQKAVSGGFGLVSGLDREIEVIENKPGGRRVVFRSYQTLKGAMPVDLGLRDRALGGASRLAASPVALWDAITLKRGATGSVAL
jgi:hypothetical protein